MDYKFKIQKATAQLTMDHPFVSAILLKHPIKERKDIPTLAVDGRGQIYYNPKFIDKLSVPQVVWGLAHEVFHRIGQHALRRGHRPMKPWNYAGDAWINDVLDEAKIGTRIEGCVNMPGSKDDTVENIYDKLPKDGGGDGGKGEGEGEGEGDGEGEGEGEGGGDGGGNGQPEDNDGIGDDILNENMPVDEAERKQLEAEMKIEVAEAAQIAKARGKLPGVLAKIAEQIIDVKTPWYDILERYMVGMTKNEYSWRRPNRKFAASDIYLPSLDNVPKMGKVLCQVDISGSVSQEEIKHYGGHIARIVEMCRPEEVDVIYTDTHVQKHEHFECGEEVHIGYYSGGGTDMCEGYRWAEREGMNDVDVFITLTDGYTGFPDKVDVPSIWVISSEIKAPDHAGETIHFEMEKA
jgi:predicted metal-dependent peptidase